MSITIQAAQGDAPPINRRTTFASLLLAAKKANETPLEPLQLIQASDEAPSPSPENREQGPSRNPAVVRCFAASLRKSEMWSRLTKQQGRVNRPSLRSCTQQ